MVNADNGFFFIKNSKCPPGGTLKYKRPLGPLHENVFTHTTSLYSHAFKNNWVKFFYEPRRPIKLVLSVVVNEKVENRP